jgi:hypothetical protein
MARAELFLSKTQVPAPSPGLLVGASHSRLPGLNKTGDNSYRGQCDTACLTVAHTLQEDGSPPFMWIASPQPIPQ